VQPVVDVVWLREHRDEVVVADVRWYLDGRSGREAYLAGHLPGAVFVSMDTCLAAPPSSADGRHPLPHPVAFASCMSTLGIGDGQAVVAYDDARGSVAARLVWMLRTLDEPAGLLDGGLQAWDGPLEEGPAAVTPACATFTPRPWPPERLVTMDDVAAGGLVVVDARAAERYRGDVEPIDRRAGHIPGAVNVPWSGNVDPETGRFLPPDELRRRYEPVLSRGRDVAVHCGSGVTACHDLLAIERAGLPPARLYAGSWSQWAADESRPVATGPDPGPAVDRIG
jgi:thiosulfate/3-mercaptopyruvate sulfurtransferase